MKIAGLQKSSTVDYPGCFCAVIFVSGCNYRCFYCHNRMLLGDVPLLDEAHVISFMEKRAGLIDGMVFSGGEPTLHKDLAWWMNRAKKLGYKTKLDTNGSRPQVLKSILSAGLADYVAMDYKAPVAMYPKLCLAPGSGVMESMELLSKSGVEYEIRTTAVPMLTEAVHLEKAENIPDNARWALQLYRQQPGDEEYLHGLTPYLPSDIETLAKALRVKHNDIITRC